uniref:Putative ovule protein n=1 Tax=Solanum chacoense TaxID=4108 RepID=A0A0V0I8B9_SOLCH
MVRQSLSVAPYLEFFKHQVLEPSQHQSTDQQYGPYIHLRTVNVHRSSTLGQISLICLPCLAY